MNGSILIFRFAVERLDKNNYFQKKQKFQKKCVKNFGWAVKNGLKRHLLYFLWQ